MCAHTIEPYDASNSKIRKRISCFSQVTQNINYNTKMFLSIQKPLTAWSRLFIPYYLTMSMIKLHKRLRANRQRLALGFCRGSEVEMKNPKIVFSYTCYSNQYNIVFEMSSRAVTDTFEHRFRIMAYLYIYLSK